MELINRILYNLLEVHPLHTMVVHFPIALTGAALFFVLVALFQRSEMLEQAAFANIALAAVSTIVAGITGMRDNIDIYDGVAPNAGAKIALAITLLIITTLLAIIRWRKPDVFYSSGRVLYVAGFFVSFAIAAALGFLGGVILYGF
jgi:uncharacterized membrane protein